MRPIWVHFFVIFYGTCVLRFPWGNERSFFAVEIVGLLTFDPDAIGG
jgi:hypothetical protein